MRVFTENNSIKFLQLFTAILIFWLLFDLNAVSAVEAGGSHIGNGGDVVVCEEPARSVELFDIFEMREIRGMVLDIDSEAQTHQVIIDKVIDRIAERNPTRASQYREWFDEFYQEVHFTENDLVDIPDSGIAEIPHGCVLEQIAVQMNVVELPGDYLYTIRKDLWLELDELNKAVLIMHELIYREAKYRFDHSNSKFSRYFLANILANNLQNMGDKEYVDLLQIIRFEYADVAGYQVKVLEGPVDSFFDSHIAFYPNGKPKILTILDGQEIELLGQPAFTSDNSIIGFKELGGVNKASYVSLGNDLEYSTKYLKFIIESSGFGCSNICEIVGIVFDSGDKISDLNARVKRIRGDNFSFRPIRYLNNYSFSISLYSNGRLRHAFLNFGDRNINKLKFKSKWVEVAGGKVDFFENGQLASANLSKVMVKRYRHLDGNEYDWFSQDGTYVRFFENGELKSFVLDSNRAALAVDVQEKRVVFSGKRENRKLGTIGFYADGSVRYGRLKNAVKLWNQEREEELYEAGRWLTFGRDGLVFCSDELSEYCKEPDAI